jgi:hypothetical protein
LKGIEERSDNMDFKRGVRTGVLLWILSIFVGIAISTWLNIFNIEVFSNAFYLVQLSFSAALIMIVSYVYFRGGEPSGALNGFKLGLLFLLVEFFFNLPGFISNYSIYLRAERLSIILLSYFWLLIVTTLFGFYWSKRSKSEVSNEKVEPQEDEKPLEADEKKDDTDEIYTNKILIKVEKLGENVIKFLQEKATTIAVILIVVGTLGFFYSQPNLKSYETQLGYETRALNPNIQNQYETLKFIKSTSIVLIILGGLNFVIGRKLLKVDELIEHVIRILQEKGFLRTRNLLILIPILVFFILPAFGFLVVAGSGWIFVIVFLLLILLLDVVILLLRAFGYLVKVFRRKI